MKLKGPSAQDLTSGASALSFPAMRRLFCRCSDLPYSCYRHKSTANKTNDVNDSTVYLQLLFSFTAVGEEEEGQGLLLLTGFHLRGSPQILNAPQTLLAPAAGRQEKALLLKYVWLGKKKKKWSRKGERVRVRGRVTQHDCTHQGDMLVIHIRSHLIEVTC